MTINDKLAEVASKLVQAGYTEEALVILEAKKKKKDSVYYQNLAKKRMDDAFDKAGQGPKGVEAVLKTVKQRIKKVTKVEKLWGIVAALDDLIQKSKDFKTKWGVKDAEKKFIALRAEAKKKAEQLEKSKKK